MGSVSAWLVAAALAAAFVCPQGAAPMDRKTAEARERWCQRPDGTRHGPRHAWHADGSKWFEGEYDAGQRSGAWTFWHPSGKLRSKGSYRADKRDGPSEHWHDNGARAMVGSCKAGRKHGVWKSFWPDGSPEATLTFRDGQPVAAQYVSRRGQPVALDAWIADKVRGARPGSARFERAKKRYARNGIFEECAN